MRILLTSEYDREILLEDDISPTAIYNELVDRAVEIEVSIDEVCEWLETEQQSLQVAQDFGDTIKIVKDDCDTHPTLFVDTEGIYNTNDLYNQVVESVPETPALDTDIGKYPYETPSRLDPYERLRRWVESHPMQWHRLTYAEIASETHLSVTSVYHNLCECVISAKYVSDENEYKQKRKQSRTGQRKKTRHKSNLIPKIHEWLIHNYNRWQSMTFDEISKESDTSFSTVYNNLPKLLLAEGFVSSLYDYEKKRKDNRGYKGKKSKSNQPVNYFIEVI